MPDFELSLSGHSKYNPIFSFQGYQAEAASVYSGSRKLATKRRFGEFARRFLHRLIRPSPCQLQLEMLGEVG
jgi:hypothetical protein